MLSLWPKPWACAVEQCREHGLGYSTWGVDVCVCGLLSAFIVFFQVASQWLSFSELLRRRGAVPHGADHALQRRGQAQAGHHGQDEVRPITFLGKNYKSK